MSSDSTVWDWSTNANSNGTVGGGLNIAANCPMTGINGAIRAVMAATLSALSAPVAGGTANALTVTQGIAPGTYTTSTQISFIAASANSSTATINLNSLGAKNLFAGDAALVGGELQAGRPYLAIYDGTQFQLLGAQKQPTITTFTGSTGTYSTPSGAVRLRVRLVGGGGGGGGTSSNGGGATSGNSGTNTTFGSLTAGGGIGSAANGGAGGGGGSPSGGNIANIGGSAGGSTGYSTVSVSGIPGGCGGSSILGGGAPGTLSDGSIGNGLGGGGAGGAVGSGITQLGAGGGGGGAYVENIYVDPAATYSYAVGTGGSGGSAGTSGHNGGTGGAGGIIIEEYYA